MTSTGGRRGARWALVAGAATLGAVAAGCGGGGGGATGTGPGGVPAAYLASCEACHPDGGRREGSGPRLAGQGWDAARIRRSIDEGIGTMPGGLIDGAQAAEVTRYVRGLQRPEPPVTTR